MEQSLAVIRWILHKLFIVFLGATIWFMVPFIAMSTNFTDVDQVKLWFVNANTYELFLNQSVSFIDLDSETDKILEKTPAAFNEESLIASVKTAIPAEYLQEQVEEVVDGIYSWLDGETPGPEFIVTLSGQKEDIAEAVRKELLRQLSVFPECTQEQIAASDGQFDPFESPCIPPGLSVEQEVDLVVSSFMNEEDSIFNQEFTGDDLELSDSSKLNGPATYDTMELMPIFYWSFLLSFSALVILTARHWRQGFKMVGITVSIVSGILLVLGLLIQRLSNLPGRYIVEQEASNSREEAARVVITPLAKTITEDFGSSAVYYSLLTLLFGLIMLGIGWKLAPKKKGKGDKNNEDEVPELLRDSDKDISYIDKIEDETQKEKKKPGKIRKKINSTKKKLIQ